MGFVLFYGKGWQDMSDESDGFSDTTLSLDEMLDLLANRQRRCLLEGLKEEADPTVSLDDAVSYVGNQIAEESEHQPTEEDVKVQLRHHHLPRLAESNLVDFDPRSETIRYRENEQLEAFHEHVRAFRQE